MANSGVYESLRTLIIRGKIAPGARVVETEVAERLKVSRTPAREAIIRLHREGFLVSTGNARRTEVAVAPLTVADLNDLYRIMGALEGAAAIEVSALSTDKRHALGRELTKLEHRFETAARKTHIDYEQVFELHNAFHEKLIETCAAPRLKGLIAMVRPQVERYEWVYAPLIGPGYDETFDEHQAIIRSLRDRTGERARRAVIANWEQGARRLAAAIETLGSRGDW